MNASVTYALTDADQLNLAWDNLRRRGLYWLLAIVSIGAVALLGSRGNPGAFLFVGFLASIGLLTLSLEWFQTRSNILKELRARPLHGSSITLKATASGLEIVGAERILHGWPLVGVPKSTRTSIALPVGHATKLLIPRRFFADRDHERAFVAAILAGRTGPASPVPDLDDDGPYTYDLSYTSTYADLLALNTWFLHRNEPPGRRRKVMWGATVLTVFGLLLLPFAREKALVLVVVCGTIALFTTTRGRSWLVRYSVWRLWRRGGHDEGPIRLRARPDAVSYRGRSLLKSSWAGVVRIVEAPDHVFLFNGPATAWIVPKAVLGPERVAPFIEDVNRWLLEAAPYARPPVPKGEALDTTNPFQAPHQD